MLGMTLVLAACSSLSFRVPNPFGSNEPPVESRTAQQIYLDGEALLRVCEDLQARLRPG